MKKNMIKPIITLEQYDQAVNILDQLIDIVQEDENHPLAEVMDMIGELIQDYETRNISDI